jgi:prepilin-type N-terminal cleavage/methylation domain-containing protein
MVGRLGSTGLRRQPNGRQAEERGFTLVELLVALVVTILVVGGATVLAGQMQGSYRAQLESAVAQQDARFVLEEVTRYLRQAGNNPYRVTTTSCPASGTPFLPIRIDPDGDGVDDDVRIQMDANPTNGLIGGPPGGCSETDEDVTIFHDAANLTVAVTDANGGGAPTHSLADAVVTGLQFAYRDPSHNVTTNPANVAFIQTTVTVRTRLNDLNQGRPLEFTLSSEVRVRSR